MQLKREYFSFELIKQVHILYFIIYIFLLLINLSSRLRSNYMTLSFLLHLSTFIALMLYSRLDAA